MTNNKDTNSHKDIIHSEERRLAVRTSILARRGLELISQFSPKILHIPSEYKRIEDAVNVARAGDIIEIAPGDYKVTLTLNKSLTFRASNGDVRIYSAIKPKVIQSKKSSIRMYQKDAFPIIEINSGEAIVTFERICFIGIDAIKYPSAISLNPGKAIFKDCKFIGFGISLDTWSSIDDNNLYEEIDAKPVIKLSGGESELTLNRCVFNECLDCIQGINACRINISYSYFDLTGESSGVTLIDAMAFFEHNLFKNGAPISLLGKESKIISNYDTYFHMTDLINCYSKFEARFFHATVFNGGLICVGLGENLAWVDNYGNLIWEQPLISFSDSILFRVNGSLSFRYAKTASSFPAEKPVDILSSGILSFQNMNLWRAWDKPIYEDEFPFGTLEGNYLPLLPTSEAIKAASDGSNLGAWQG